MVGGWWQAGGGEEEEGWDGGGNVSSQIPSFVQLIARTRWGIT